MKRMRYILPVVILVAVMGWMPFRGTDVAKLHPVEVISVRSEKGIVYVNTDTGSSGAGNDLHSAFQDLKATTPGHIFFETADYLLIDEPSEILLPELYDLLRPGCKVCRATGKLELAEAAVYLRTHKPPVSLQDHKAGKQELPVLQCWEGRMYLVS